MKTLEGEEVRRNTVHAPRQDIPHPPTNVKHSSIPPPPHLSPPFNADETNSVATLNSFILMAAQTVTRRETSTTKLRKNADANTHST